MRKLLNRAPILRTPCDLDLLVFLYRHPRAMLTSERLAEFVGYDVNLLAHSLESLAEGGFLEKTLSTTHAARMYVLLLNGPQGGGLISILEVASTREGRRQLIAALSPGSSKDSGVPQGLRLVASSVARAR